MTEPNSSWICQRKSAWQPHSFNHFTSTAFWQPDPMPACVVPHHVSAYVSPNGYNVCGMPADKCLKIQDEGRFEHQLHLPSGHDWKETPYETSYSQQKKFVIFDHSGEENHMILGTVCSSKRNGAAITTNPVLTFKTLEKLHAFKPEQSFPKVPDLSEDAGENHATGEGSDYHEDTEEINALLYSTDDDIHDYEDEDGISTGRSPNAVEDGFRNMEEGEDFDEVSSMWRSSKRQKLLEEGSSSKLPSIETTAVTNSATLLCEDESVVNLVSSKGEQPIPSLSWKRTRMHRIHGKLRVLQKLIPDSKTKDPLVIIDEAISYLKSLKANSLHKEKSDGSSWSTPSL